jgi:hypothetical protein
MKTTTLGFLLGLVLLGSALADAQNASRINDLKWLTGSWRMEKMDRTIEEQWNAPAGGVMLAVGRTVKNGKLVEFEFLRIEQRGDSLVYLAQPGGQPPTEFALESMTPSEVVFANLLHDFPKRIRYKKNADGSVTARVEDDTGKKGQDFIYKQALDKSKTETDR